MSADEGLYLNLELRTQGFTPAAASAEAAAATLDGAIDKVAATAEAAGEAIVAAGQKIRAAGVDVAASGDAVRAGGEAAARGVQTVEQSAARVGTMSADAVARLKANIAEMRASLDASNFDGLAQAEARVRDLSQWMQTEAGQWDAAQRRWQASGRSTPPAGALSTGDDPAVLRAQAQRAWGQLADDAHDAGTRAAKEYVDGLLVAADKEFSFASAAIRTKTATSFLQPDAAAAEGRAVGVSYNEAVLAGMAQAQQDGKLTEETYVLLASRLKNVDSAAASAGDQLTKFRRPLTALASAAIGVPGPIGQIASSLTMLGAGSAATIGLLAGVTLIVGAWELLTAKSRAVSERIDQAADRIRALRLTAESPEIRLALDIRDAEKKIDDLTAKTTRWQSIAQYAGNLAFGPTGQKLGYLLGPVRGLAALTAMVAGDRAASAGQERDETQAGATAAMQEMDDAAQAHIDRRAADLARLVSDAKTRTAADIAAVQQMTVETKQAITELGAATGGSPEQQEYRTHLRAELQSRLQTLTAPFLKQEKQAQRDDAAAQRMQQQFQGYSDGAKALADSVTATDRPLAAYAKRMQDLDAQYDKIKTKTPEMVRQHAEWRTQLDATYRILEQREAHKLALDLAEVSAALTPSVVDDMSVALAKMEEHLHEEGASDAFIQHYHDVQTQIIAARGELEALDKALRQIKDTTALGILSGGKKGDVYTAEQFQLSQTYARAVTDSALATDPKSAEEFAQKAQDIQQQMAANQERITAAAKEEEATRRRTLLTMEKWVDHAAKGARALLDAAAAAGILDQQMQKVATDAVSTAEALTKVIATAGADVGSDLQLLASVVNLGRDVFGTSAAEKEKIRVQQENTRAVERLTQRYGDLVGLSVSGTTFGLAQNVVGSIVGQTAGYRGATKISNVGDLLTATGLSADDLTAIAKQLGITIDGTVDSYRKLATAMANADVRAFADTWAGALQQIDAVAKMDGYTPYDQLQAYAHAALTKSGSSMIASFLQGADLSTPEGRAAVRAAARRWFDQLQQGLVSESALGNLNLAEAEQFFETFIGDIDAVTSSLDTAAPAAAAAAAALEKLNAALSDIGTLGQITGATAEQVYQTVDAIAAAFPDLADQIRSILTGADLTTEAGRAAFQSHLTTFLTSVFAGGLTESEREVIKDLLPLRGVVDSIGQAAAAATPAVDGLVAATFQLSTAAKDASDAATQAATDAKRMGTDPDVAQAAAYAKSIPGIGAVDVHDPTSVAQAVGVLRNGYGGLSAGDLKDYFGSALDFFTKLLPTAAPSGAPGTTGGSTTDGRGSLTQATEATAGRLADYMAATAAHTQHMAGGIDDLLAVLTASDGLVGPPRFGAGAFSGPTTIQGGVTVQMTNEFHYHASADESPADGGQAIGRQFVDGFNSALGVQSVTDRTLLGRIGRTV